MDEKEKESTLKDMEMEEIRPILHWHEFLTLWGINPTTTVKKGLLHEGFSVSSARFGLDEPEYDEIDRLMFYFRVADGWTDSYCLKLTEDEGKEYEVGFDSCGNRIRKSPSELRQQVARKAFDMLCSNFFKAGSFERERDRTEYRKTILEKTLSVRLFPVIQNFFRVQKGKWSWSKPEILNLPQRGPDEKRPHNEKLAVQFLTDLAKFLWSWEEPDTPYYFGEGEEAKKREGELRNRIATQRVQIEEAKPWMVEILALLGQLDVLQDEWVRELNKACLAKLEEVAMRNELKTYRQHPVPKDRKVTTLDEARYAGSQAAWLLEKHELMVREHARLSKKLELEKERDKLDREMKKLEQEG